MPAMETEPAITPSAMPLDPDAFTLAYLMANEAECPACGYNVHALSAPRCPECARPLRVQVVSVQGGYSFAWVIAMVTSCITGGIGLLVAAVVAREGVHYNPFYLLFILIYFMCNIPLPLLFLAFRRMFVRLKVWQWLITVPFLLASVVMLTCFIAEIKG